MKRAAPLFLMLFLLSCTRNIDPFSKGHNFTQILASSGIPMQRYEADLLGLRNLSEFAIGDQSLVLARIRGTDPCASVKHYEKYLESADFEEKALIYETLASLNCSGRKEALIDASRLWQVLGVQWRADIDMRLANNERLYLKFSDYEIAKTKKALDKLVIGRSKITLEENDILVSQSERVNRDWLSAQIYGPKSDALLNVFSEKYFLDKELLLPQIGWHEGARIMELKQAGLTHLVATGTLAARKEGIWFAPDENGVFRFEIPDDKLDYPTTRYLDKDLAMIIDTHGINMVVEQALRMNATAVIGCCDHLGKIAAADYLAGKGIKVICPTDRFVPDLLFSENTENIIGSAPIKLEDGKAVIGDRPIEISLDEVIISTDSFDGQMYYDTPTRYFTAIGWKKLIIVPVGDRQMNEAVKAARAYDSRVISARIYFKEDYDALKPWLEEDSSRVIVLLHSIPYPYGYRLFDEFPSQTTFGDLNI